MIKAEKEQLVSPQTSRISVQIRRRRFCDHVNDTGHEHKNQKTKNGAIESPENGEKEDSFVKAVSAEVLKLEQNMPSLTKKNGPTSRIFKKRMKKSIFISYSPDADFLERRFIVETVRQLKENNLAEDIWFDQDEQCTESPCWFSRRLERAEKCRAAILFISESYFSSCIAKYEYRVFQERFEQGTNDIHIFPIVFSPVSQANFLAEIPKLASEAVDLTTPDVLPKNTNEKSSVVTRSLIRSLKRIATICSAPHPPAASDSEFTGRYRSKRLRHWTTDDVQEWLFDLGVTETDRQSLAECSVDGFLLTSSLTEEDMANYLGIDSRIVRKRILHQIALFCEKENKLAENWHLRAKSQKSRSKSLYIVYDPNDARMVETLSTDLSGKGFQVRQCLKMCDHKAQKIVFCIVPAPTSLRVAANC